MALRLRNLWPRRRWARVTIVCLLVFAVGWFVIPQAFTPIIRRKLQAMISSHVDANLDIGRLSYAPPWGVRMRDVRLVTDGGPDGRVELLKVRRVDLKLARHPFRKGPLVIENITVEGPSVHVVQTSAGLVGSRGLLRKDAPTLQTQPATRPVTKPAEGESDPVEPPDEFHARLSDMFQLRHLGVRDGRVVFEDRTRPDLPPVVWKDFHIGMETAQRSKGAYGYELKANNGDLADLKASGSFDLDALKVDVGTLHLAVRAAYQDEESPLPAQVQRALRDYQVQGRVSLDASASLAFRDRTANSYQGTIEVTDASAYVPEWDATLDRLALKLSMNNALSAGDASETSRSPVPPLNVALESFEAISGDTALRLDKTELTLDRNKGVWNLAEVAGRLAMGGDGKELPKKSRPVLAKLRPRGEIQFTLAAEGRLERNSAGSGLNVEDLAFLAYPRGLSIQPPGFERPLENIGGGGTIRKERGSRVVAFRDLTATYGADRILLTLARLPLPVDLAEMRDHTRVEEIASTIDFRQPGPMYPGKFGKVIAKLRPNGPFVFGDSWYEVHAIDRTPEEMRLPDPPPRRKSDYFFSISTDSGSFTLTEERVPLLNIRGDATVSPILIDIERIRADVLGGELTGTVQITPGKPISYQGRAYVRGLDLDQVSRTYIVPEKRSGRLTGEGNLDIEFAGVRPSDGQSAFGTIHAVGEFEVLRGEFWSLPVLGEVASRMKKRQDLMVGEAAGVFEVRDGAVILRNAAASAPAIGVQGSGTIGPAKKLDLRIVAAPLGDLRDRVKQSNVPILSDVAAEVAGAFQQIMNAATSSLLYEFRVGGTLEEPEFKTVPVPLLSDGTALLLRQMVAGDKDRKLIDAVRERKDAGNDEARNQNHEQITKPK